MLKVTPDPATLRPEGYQPFPSAPDELLDAEGQVRPVWRRFLAHFLGLPPDEMARHCARGDQYLLDSGVFYRQYSAGQSVERPWPLSHIPVLIEEAEWQTIGEGLIQRANLLEAVMADLYGENRLVSEGHLPPELVAGNPEWLRPLVGVRPRSGHFLHLLAFEIGRGPDGDWWILADRAQAPSGVGFALENRVATTRVYSDIFAGQHVHRLAGFFRTFRDALQNLRHDGESRVAILTPGPLNETYYEHAYIASYLGFTLIQGEDLIVVDGEPMVRTVSGLRPLSVLWRRLDSAYADPLELNPDTRIGTPGLVSALRLGGLTMVNALGSGVLETRALMAFLPKIAPVLLGEKLKMPNIATWWCGGEAERDDVLDAPERMIISPALATGLPFEGAEGGELASNLSPEQLAERLNAAWVAQEAVTLSTTPVLVNGKLTPRPMTLRAFLARTPDGWQVMPGGFARVGAAPEPSAVAMQRGGSAADVWIVSDREVEAVTMVPPTTGPYRRVTPAVLPSRAADNLFWLGRYVERTEGIVRLLRAHNVRLAESGAAAAPLLEALDPLFETFDIDPSVGLPQGFLSTLTSAIGCAGQVRDRLSPDAWSALIDLDKTARRMASRVTVGDDAARALSALLRKLTGFSGLVHENMYRFNAWRFLEIGRRHERAMGMTAILATLADPEAPAGSLDLAVEAGDSVLSHRRRFTFSTTRDTVIDLLGLDQMNPRSIRYQLDGMSEQIARLPGAIANGELSDLSRAMLRCHTDLATRRPEDLDTKALWALRGDIAGLSSLLTEAYMR
ncbi:MAG: hypothetical protein CFE31_13730 [Rhizobiales bacterium PAR1]|nr:MAG: hypothetical protein CFE31_13730 [Rhizobiales bacterium PAR1]